MIRLIGRINDLKDKKYRYTQDELVEDTLNFSVRVCQHPYLTVKDHLIIRDKQRDFVFPFQEDIKNRELNRIKNDYKALGYGVWENPDNDKSVTKIPHIHLLKHQDYTPYMIIKLLKKYFKLKK